MDLKTGEVTGEVLEDLDLERLRLGEAGTSGEGDRRTAADSGSP